MVPGVRGGTTGALALLAVLVFALVAGDGEEPPPRESAPTRSAATADVVRVVDGDTIEVDLGGEIEAVRYIGVDTPETVKPGEPVQCWGPQASAFNHRLVDGETVRLVFDRELRDVYGRLLAYVHANGVFVNAELVREGFARTLEIPPNTARAGQLSRLEQRAGEAGIGLWGACGVGEWSATRLSNR